MPNRSSDRLIFILEHKASINIQDNKGYTPLHNAVIFNVPSVVEILLNREANPGKRSWNFVFVPELGCLFVKTPNRNIQ